MHYLGSIDIAWNAAWFKEATEYCGRLNILQCTRYILLIEPMLSLIYAYKSFCSVGTDSLKQPEFAAFLSESQAKMQMPVT